MLERLDHSTSVSCCAPRNKPHNARDSGQPQAGPIACAGYGAFIRTRKNPAPAKYSDIRPY
jgi:hypothetical protein